MKKKIISLLTVLFGLLTQTACVDYLDNTPDDDMTIEEVFAEKAFAERFLSSCYFNLPEETSFNDNNPGRNPFVGASDEMEITWPYPFCQSMNEGAWNPVDVMNEIWNFAYEGNRKLNIFLDNIENTPMEENLKTEWIGEAEFLRAFFHFCLIRVYGPIPLADRQFGTDDDYYSMKRNTLEECINFVVEECDKAAAKLPIKQTANNYGRATRAASLALKGRMLLYAASPLFNGNPDYNNYKDNEGIKLFPDKDDSKWQTAANAAKACIDEVEAAGYKLYVSASNDPMANYQDLFLNRWNEEVLFARNFGVADHTERCISPNGMGGWSGYGPTQEIVDAYEMANGIAPITGYRQDGSPIINPASGYQEEGFTTEAHPKGYYEANISNMYANRDPRFYASINFNGAMWRGRQIEFYASGIDGIDRSPVDYTKTGYLMRKTSSPTVNIPEGRFEFRTWIYFRLAEQYLNYAEALNEAQGPIGDVHTYVNKVRSRSGMPNLPTNLTQDEMRERIRNERRIELAFETHRYFDCHRWKLAEETDNREFYSMNIRGGNSITDPEFYKRTYMEKRLFEKKHYFFPIRQEEIQKSRALLQSPYWETVEEGE